MTSVAHPRNPLSADEREVIIVYNDATRSWTIFSDSVTWRRRLLRLAREVGAEVRPVGEGFQFAAPAEALRLAARGKPRGRASPMQKSRIQSAPEPKVTIVDGPLASR